MYECACDKAGNEAVMENIKEVGQVSALLVIFCESTMSQPVGRARTCLLLFRLM